jgi:hypothetical protein
VLVGRIGLAERPTVVFAGLWPAFFKLGKMVETTAFVWKTIWVCIH